MKKVKLVQNSAQIAQKRFKRELEAKQILTRKVKKVKLVQNSAQIAQKHSKSAKSKVVPNCPETL